MYWNCRDQFNWMRNSVMALQPSFSSYSLNACKINQSNFNILKKYASPSSSITQISESKYFASNQKSSDQGNCCRCIQENVYARTLAENYVGEELQKNALEVEKKPVEKKDIYINIKDSEAEFKGQRERKYLNRNTCSIILNKFFQSQSENNNVSARCSHCSICDEQTEEGNFNSKYIDGSVCNQNSSKSSGSSFCNCSCKHLFNKNLSNRHKCNIGIQCDLLRCCLCWQNKTQKFSNEFVQHNLKNDNDDDASNKDSHNKNDKNSMKNFNANNFKKIQSERCLGGAEMSRVNKIKSMLQYNDLNVIDEDKKLKDLVTDSHKNYEQETLEKIHNYTSNHSVLVSWFLPQHKSDKSIKYSSIWWDDYFNILESIALVKPEEEKMFSHGNSNYNIYCNRCYCYRYCNACTSYSAPDCSTRSMCFQSDACSNYNMMNKNNDQCSSTFGVPSCNIPMQRHTCITSISCNKPEPLIGLPSSSTFSQFNVRLKNDTEKSKPKTTSEHCVKKNGERRSLQSAKNSNANDNIRSNKHPSSTEKKTKPEYNQASKYKRHSGITPDTSGMIQKKPPSTVTKKDPIKPRITSPNIESKFSSNKDYTSADTNKSKPRLHNTPISERTEKRNNSIGQHEGMGNRREDRAKQRSNSVSKSTNGTIGSVGINSKGKEHLTNGRARNQLTKQSFEKNDNNCCCSDKIAHASSKRTCNDRQLNTIYSDEESPLENCSSNNSYIDDNRPIPTATYKPVSNSNKSADNYTTPNNRPRNVEYCPSCNKKKFNYCNEGSQQMCKTKGFYDSDTNECDILDRDDDDRKYLRGRNVKKDVRERDYSTSEFAKNGQVMQSNGFSQAQNKRYECYKGSGMENACSGRNGHRRHEPEMSSDCQCAHQKLHMAKSFSDAMINVHILKGNDFDENNIEKYEHPSSSNTRSYEENGNKKFIVNPSNYLPEIHYECIQIMRCECCLQQVPNKNENQELSAHNLNKLIKRCNCCCTNLFTNNQTKTELVELYKLNNENSEQNGQQKCFAANTWKCKTLDLSFPRNPLEVTIIPGIPFDEEFQDTVHKRTHSEKNNVLELSQNNLSTTAEFKGSENKLKQNKSFTFDVSHAIKENKEKFSSMLNSTILPNEQGTLESSNGKMSPSAETLRPIVEHHNSTNSKFISEKSLNEKQSSNLLLPSKSNLETSEKNEEDKNILSPVTSEKTFLKYLDEMEHTAEENVEVEGEEEDDNEEVDFIDTRCKVNFSNLSRDTKDEILKGLEEIKCYCSKLSEHRKNRILKNMNELHQSEKSRLNGSTEISYEAISTNNEISEIREIRSSPLKTAEKLHRTENKKSHEISNQNSNEKLTSSDNVPALHTISPPLKNIEKSSQPENGMSINVSKRNSKKKDTSNGEGSALQATSSPLKNVQKLHQSENKKFNKISDQNSNKKRKRNGEGSALQAKISPLKNVQKLHQPENKKFNKLSDQNSNKKRTRNGEGSALQAKSSPLKNIQKLHQPENRKLNEISNQNSSKKGANNGKVSATSSSLKNVQKLRQPENRKLNKINDQNSNKKATSNVEGSALNATSSPLNNVQNLHQPENTASNEESNQNSNKNAASQLSALRITSPNLKNGKELQQSENTQLTKNKQKTNETTPNKDEISVINEINPLLKNGSKLHQSKNEKSNENNENSNKVTSSRASATSAIRKSTESNESSSEVTTSHVTENWWNSIVSLENKAQPIDQRAKQDRNQTKIAKDNTKGPPNTILSSIQSAIYESNMAVSAQSAKLKKNTKLTNNSHAENNVNSSVSNLIGNNLSKNRSRGGNNSEGEYSNIMKHLGGAFYKKSNSNMNVNNGNAKNDNKNAIISTTSRESKTRANTKSTDNSKGSSKLPSVLSSTPIIRGKQEKRNGLNSDDNIRNCQVISRSDSRRSPLLPFGLSMPSANAKGSNMGQSKNAFRSECTRSARSPVSALPIATPINSDTDYKSIFMLSYTAKDSQIESNVKNNNNIKLLPSLSSFQKLDKNNDNKMPALDVRDDIDIIGRNNENFQVFITKKPPTQSNQSECHCNKSPCDIKESRNSKNSNSIDFKKCISTIKNAKHGINCKNMRSAGGTNYSKQYMGRKMEVINEETESEAEASDINDPNYKDIQKKHKMAENMQKARRRPIEDCCTDFLSIVHDNIMQSVQKSLKQLMAEYSRQNMQQMRALQNKVNQHENKLDKIYSDLLEKMQIHTNNNNLRQQSKYVDDKRKLNKDNSLSSLQVVSVQSSFKESDSKDRGRVQNNLKYRKTIGVQCAILRRASEVKDKHKKHRNNDEFTNIPKTARGNLEDDDNTNLSAENSVEEMAVLHDDSCVELSCPKNMEELFSAVEKHRETNRKKKVLNSYHEHSDDSEENNEFFKSNKKKMNAHNDDNTNGYDVSVPDEMIVNDCNDSSHTIGENDYNINKRSLSETESNESDDQYHYDDYHQKPARYHIKERRYHSDEQLIPPNINKNEEIRKRDSSQRSMRKVEFCTCHEH